MLNPLKSWHRRHSRGTLCFKGASLGWGAGAAGMRGVGAARPRARGQARPTPAPCFPSSHLLHSGHPRARGRLPDRGRPAQHLHGHRPPVSDRGLPALGAGAGHTAGCRAVGDCALADLGTRGRLRTQAWGREQCGQMASGSHVRPDPNFSDALGRGSVTSAASVGPSRVGFPAPSNPPVLPNTSGVSPSQRASALASWWVPGSHASVPGLQLGGFQDHLLSSVIC